MVKKKKNKQSFPLLFSIPLFLYSWMLFFVVSFNLFSFLIKLINYPTAFTLFIFPIVCAFWFIILLVSLFFASEINKRLKQLKIIKK